VVDLAQEVRAAAAAAFLQGPFAPATLLHRVSELMAEWEEWEEWEEQEEREKQEE
jgi:hypothetical protein